MTPRSSKLLRQLPYLVVGLALLMIAALAVQQTLLLRQDLADQQARQAAQTLRGMVSYWESSVLRQTRAWIDELEEAPDIADAEQRMRRAAPWFDAIYIWEPSPRPRMRYPPPATLEDPVRLIQHPCILRAGNILRLRGSSLAIEAYRACREAPPRYHLYTSSMAAALLLQQGRPSEAWRALGEVGMPIDLPLRDAAAQGLPLDRVISRRIQAAQALGSMGQHTPQLELLLSTAHELAELDARQLDELASFLKYTIPRELQQAGAPQAIAELTEDVSRAERRVDAYKDIVQRLIARPVPSADGDIQITLDPYERYGFLLAYAPIADGQLIVAVQLDPIRLLEELPKTPDLPERIILDAEGRMLTGEPLNVSDIWVQVPFGRLFPHLRIGLRRPADHMEDQKAWLASQLAPVALALMLGGLAIGARVRADRRREELYARQKDFITRVTHELKTPLAGIRLMAETLEMIGGEDPEQQTFIGRILQEVERLTTRIDEVLRLTREPALPRRETLSPALLADALWDEWAPRFEEVGGTLTLDADLEMKDILADEALLVDALNNLLSNALKYRASERDLQCSLRVREDSRTVTFEVEDNGMGVPEEMRTAIFERFTRVEGPNRGRSGGHGLGLSFVAETARAHGGDATCQPRPEGGTIFSLRIRKR